MLSLPGWDLDVVRREMCFVDFLERQCVEMEIITAGRQSQFSQVGVPLAAGTIDMFPKLTKKMRSLSEQLVRFPLFIAVCFPACWEMMHSKSQQLI